MQKISHFVILVLLVLSACQPASDDALPTLAQLPTTEPSPTLSPTPEDTRTPTPSPTPEDTATPTPSPTSTTTPTLTRTPTPTQTLIPAVANTAAAVSSATAVVLEQPTLSTFTPIPPGVVVRARPTSTGTPEVNADVVITQIQLQEEVDRIIITNRSPSLINVNIIDGGIDLVITAPDDAGATTTGTVFVAFQMSMVGLNNVLIAQPVPPDDFRMFDGEFPPDAFIDVAYTEAVPALFQAFDDILNYRLGQGQHDLENVTFIDDAMLVTLVVPLSN